MDYRGDDLFEERKVSVKSKSVGLAMRLAGVICDGRCKSFKFVAGLENLGLRVLTPGKKHLKRLHYDDQTCEDRESLKKKYKMQLNM